MENQIFSPGTTDNEQILDYAPGSAERTSLEARLDSMAGEIPEIPCIVGGEAVFTGEIREQFSPHDRNHVIARWHCATPEVVQQAVEAAQLAWKEWSAVSQQVRSAVSERAAVRLQGSHWRNEINASTM